MRQTPFSPVAFAAVLAFALGACGAIPLSTAVRFAAFDETTFASLDPRMLRVRISVPRGYAWDPASVKLATEVGVAGKTRSDAFQLAAISEEAAVRGEGMLRPGVPVITTTLRLSEVSIDGFQGLQHFVAARRTERIHLDVRMSMLSAPKSVRSFEVWIEVMLTPSEGYLTLIDGGTVPLNETQAYGAPKKGP